MVNAFALRRCVRRSLPSPVYRPSRSPKMCSPSPRSQRPHRRFRPPRWLRASPPLGLSLRRFLGPMMRLRRAPWRYWWPGSRAWRSPAANATTGIAYGSSRLNLAAEDRAYLRVSISMLLRGVVSKHELVAVEYEPVGFGCYESIRGLRDLDGRAHRAAGADLRSSTLGVVWQRVGPPAGR